VDGHHPRITDTELGETLLDRSCLLNGGKEISGKLRMPAEYRETVTLPDTKREHEPVVAYFDTCNDYRTTVTFSSDGMIMSETIRTEFGSGSE
jgi:hypothetical protein